MIYKNSALENNNYSVDIDLVKDLKDISKQRLKSMGYTFADNADEDWIRLYFNAQKRLISNTPRTVIKSKEFQCPDKFVPALKEIENKFINGENVSPYMSKTITNLSYHDLLLYDWGIYHFHLGTKEKGQRFATRSSQQLFVYIKDDAAYFVQTYPHNKENLYTTQEMVKILHDNWPDKIEDRKLNGFKSAERFSDKQYQEIRKSGGLVIIDIGDGNIYGMLGGGYASNGSSIEVTRNTDYWKEVMENYQDLIVIETNNIIGGIEKLTNKTAIRDLVIKMICLNDDEISLFEENNRVCLQFYKKESFYRICFPQDLFREQENYKWIKMR